MLDSPPVNWFTENPTPVLLAGGAILIFLVLRFFKTGELKLFWWIAGVGAFMGLAVLTDHLIVTDREQVENVIYKAGADAEHNNLEAVIDIIAPEATLVRTDARQWIGQVHLNLVNIGGLDVQLDKTSQSAHRSRPLLGAGRWRSSHSQRDLPQLHGPLDCRPAQSRRPLAGDGLSARLTARLIGWRLGRLALRAIAIYRSPLRAMSDVEFAMEPYFTPQSNVCGSDNPTRRNDRALCRR